MFHKKGQVTIFIIIAIILVAAVIVFFAFRGLFSSESFPHSIQPAYTSFLSCLQEDLIVGIDILESQGGYIYAPEYEPGSLYMPFSSQLNFLGNPIPYWYYVSGNNIQKEQVPSRTEMEKDLEKFIEGQISTCVLDSYYEQGFEIEKGLPEADVSIKKDEVEVNLKMNLVFSKDEDNAIAENHNVAVKSNLGNLYDAAREIYSYEQNNLFLETYGVDTLRLYAPVDGVEMTCAPMTWNADEVFDELENAIEANTLALKIKGGDYTLNDKENKYFVLDLPVSESQVNVLFLNSKNWPKSFEVTPAEGNLLIAEPIGNQQGLGILGFCYAPYHFIYDVKYPVLVQIYSGEEIFQFPLAVVIKSNKPREALKDATAIDPGFPELCKYKNTLTSINVYDVNLNPIEADISFECFGEKCDIGKTSLSSGLNENLPQCANGFLFAKAEGYEDARVQHSTIEEGNVEIFLDKLYDVGVNLKLDGKDYNKDAIIYFIGEESQKTILYPDSKTVELSEGQYEIQVQIYKNSSLKIEGEQTEHCVDVPRSGLGGILGLTDEQCFDIEIPEQIVSNALAGGGKENYYILESELANNGIMEIQAQSLPTPITINQLQENYILFENQDLNIYFK
jgi:hypothetical protein